MAILFPVGRCFILCSHSLSSWESSFWKGDTRISGRWLCKYANISWWDLGLGCLFFSLICKQFYWGIIHMPYNSPLYIQFNDFQSNLWLYRVVCNYHEIKFSNISITPSSETLSLFAVTRLPTSRPFNQYFTSYLYGFAFSRHFM